MNFQPFINTIAQAGVWCIAAFLMGKMFLDYVKKDKEHDREDMKEERAVYNNEKERIYSLYERQSKILEQQSQMLSELLSVSQHNRDMLDKLTNIQMLHTNRLDRLEDRQSRLELELKDVNQKLSK